MASKSMKDTLSLRDSGMEPSKELLVRSKYDIAYGKSGRYALCGVMVRFPAILLDSVGLLICVPIWWNRGKTGSLFLSLRSLSYNLEWNISGNITIDDEGDRIMDYSLRTYNSTNFEVSWLNGMRLHISEWADWSQTLLFQIVANYSGNDKTWTWDNDTYQSLKLHEVKYKFQWEQRCVCYWIDGSGGWGQYC